ncbi:MAG: hypothetical protein IJF12_04395 [Alphaproteobacteria bacterium]|nr:hypothetical protein [Alphaproteobacteria bacterium]
MRKYFLLSAVALLSASNVNATEFGEVSVSATVNVADTFECSEITWGSLTVKRGNGDITILPDSSILGDKESIIRSELFPVISNCDFIGNEFIGPENFGFPENVPLTGETTNNTISIKDITANFDGDYILTISASLDIPANVVADTYRGAFTFYVMN